MTSGRKVTMMDVAKKAGVSIASVSVVLNDTGSISKKMRQKVMEAAEELGYEQNLAARALKTGRSQIIGLIVPNVANPYFAELIQWVIDAARAKGHIVSVVDTQNSEQRELDGLNFFSQHHVTGIIWCAPRLSEESIANHIEDAQVVIVDSIFHSFDSICPDHESGGRQLGEYVVSQGHQRIGIVAGPHFNYSAKLRRRGLIKAIDGKAEISWITENSYTDKLSRDTLEHVRSQDTSLIMCANDMIAIGVMLALRTTRVGMSGSVSITGFDDIHLGEALTPQLTTVHIPTKTLATEAVEMLLQRISGLDSPRRHLVVDVELKIRDSVAQLIK